MAASQPPGAPGGCCLWLRQDAIHVLRFTGEQIGASVLLLTEPFRMSRFYQRVVCVLILVLSFAVAGLTWYKTTRPDYRLRRGQEAARRGDLVTAEQYLDLLELAGADDHVSFLKGEIALRQNSPRTALAHINRIKAESPLRTSAALLAAECLMALGRLREAEQALFYVLERQPTNADAHRRLAIVYYDQGDYSRAMPHLEEVARLDPKDARPHRTMGLIYKDMDEEEMAVAAYEESLKRNPKQDKLDEVRVELAECLLKLYKEGEVLKALDGVDAPEAHTMRAEAMIALGRESEVAEILDSALHRWPGHGGLMRLRGERFLAAGQPVEAARLLEKVVAQDAHDYRSHNQLARAYDEQERHLDAAVHHKKVREIQAILSEIYERQREAEKNPWDPRPRYQLAELCEKVGRTKFARMWKQAAEACRAPTS